MKKTTSHISVKNKPGIPRANHYAFRLVTGGIVFCALILTTSLLSFFRPGLLKQLAQQAVVSVSSFIATSFDRIQNIDLPSFNNPTEADAPPITISQETGDINSLKTFSSQDTQTETYIVMLDTAIGPMLYYNQGDIRWGDYLYGGFDPMSSYGCGPTAVAMVVNSFVSPITPDVMADWAAANGYYAKGSGSYHSLIPESLSFFGLNAESVSDRSAQNAASLLESGHILIALMGKGSLTNNGHFILITRLLEDGSVSIADPNSYENTEKRWDLTQLMEELKTAYDSGGPLWAVSMPPSG